MKKRNVKALVFFVLGVLVASNVEGAETEPPAPALKPAVHMRANDIIYGRKYGMA